MKDRKDKVGGTVCVWGAIQPTCPTPICLMAHTKLLQWFQRGQECKRTSLSRWRDPKCLASVPPTPPI